jgi:K+-transporting ATPase KdpF subunit
MTDAGYFLGCCHDRIFRRIDRIRAFLRSPEVESRRNVMDIQSLIMLIISAAVTVYLFYALLRPEKF